ncbi:MAG TPA: Mov34/MPN/PAD-1 family protein [Methylomirabilota bacterium]|nr:Mov34/MPN/PAD-1 family protein [Methylomirabilota bacterium]
MILTAEEFSRIRAQAEAEYPAECCGVVLVRPTGPADRLLLPCRNIQNELHAKDPVRHPRDARTAYFIDPKDLLAIGRREAQGYRVTVIYHSHIDAGAYFSETDKRNALMNGEPAYPEAAYIVASVVERRLVDAGVFVWDPETRDFVPSELKTA